MSFFQWLEKAGVTSHPGGWAATERLLAYLNFNAESPALELGCGHGRTLAYAARKFGVRVVGVDLMPNLASSACKRLRKEGVVGFALAADVCRLPFRNETFQTAWAESVFVFLPKPDAFVEVARVLKTNGIFGMVELTWRDKPQPNYSERNRKFLGLKRYEILALQEWVQVLERVGLKVKVAEKMPSHVLPSPLSQKFSDWWDLTRLGLGLVRQLPVRKWLEGAKVVADLFANTVPAIFVATKEV